MLIEILGKRWKLRFTCLQTVAGYCDPPDKPNKEICIDKRLTGERELEILIHEFRHAADWSRDESYVAAEAKDLARMLWRLGYRREHP